MSPRGFRAVVVLWTLVLAVLTLRATAEQTQAPAPPGPEQPIPYSHKRHVALGLQCRFCHVNPEAGKLMTYPPTTTCMGCHVSVAIDRPAIKTLASFASSKEAIPWVRVYQTPDYVFWRHGTHLEAGVTCEECHGPVAERDVIARETDVSLPIATTATSRARSRASCPICLRRRRTRRATLIRTILTRTV
jgi:hypothetical protein